MSVFELLREFNEKFGIPTPNLPEPLDYELALQRQNFLEEEVEETREAMERGDFYEIIDGLIDTIYVAAGTLTMMGLDCQAHFQEVHDCNMCKERGVKPGRVMQYDLFKPEGWVGPNHRRVIHETIIRRPRCQNLSL